MNKISRFVWLVTSIGIYLVAFDKMPTPEVKFYAFLSAPIFALPLPITVSLLQKGLLRPR